MRRFHHRRGVNAVQWVVIATATVLFAGIQIIGSRTSTWLNQTVTGIGTPQSVTTRFGS